MSKLNTNSNAYIIIYSTILVVVVAFLLAFVSSALKDKQEANVALDVKKQILNSLNLRGLDDQQAEAKYAEVVKQESELNGQKYYICQVGDEQVTVVSLKGMGLWGGISGYVAIHGDEPTVYGAYFNHESETAGLGAEIKDSRSWQEKFIGKKVFSGNDVALSVVKNVSDPTTQVDCVTGATLTSNGVNDMLKTGLANAAPLLRGAAGCCQEKAAGCCKAAAPACCQEKADSCCKAAAPACCQEKADSCCKAAAPACCQEQASASN